MQIWRRGRRRSGPCTHVLQLPPTLYHRTGTTHTAHHRPPGPCLACAPTVLCMYFERALQIVRCAARPPLLRSCRAHRGPPPGRGVHQHPAGHGRRGRAAARHRRPHRKVVHPAPPAHTPQGEAPRRRAHGRHGGVRVGWLGGGRRACILRAYVHACVCEWVCAGVRAYVHLGALAVPSRLRIQVDARAAPTALVPAAPPPRFASRLVIGYSHHEAQAILPACLPACLVLAGPDWPKTLTSRRWLRYSSFVHRPLPHAGASPCAPLTASAVSLRHRVHHRLAPCTWFPAPSTLHPRCRSTTCVPWPWTRWWCTPRTSRARGCCSTWRACSSRCQR